MGTAAVALAALSPAVAQNVNETNSAPVTLSGNYTVASTGMTTFFKQAPGGLEFTGTISGGASGATLYLNTSGSSETTFTFSGSNSFAGQIRLNTGSLVVNNLAALGNPANVVYLNSYRETTVGNLRFNLSGTFANPINNADLAWDNTIGVGANNVTLTGSIYGNGGLTKYGAGTLTITGSNSYANGTAIAAGTLQVGNGGATGSLGSGAVSNSGALVFNRSGSLTVAGAISGTGSLTQAGPGTTVLTGSNTYTGVTTISSGTLQVGNGGSGSTIGGSGTIANNGSLVFNIGDSQTLSRPVAGTGSFTKAGAGSLTLSGTSTYSGGTVIGSGTLAVAGPGNIGSGTVSFTGAAGLTVTGSSATFANVFDLGSVSGQVKLGTPINSLTTIDGVIRGGAADTVLFFEGGGSGQNTGALRLNGINTLTGTIQIQQGPLILGNAGAAGAARIVLNSNLPAAGALQFADSFTIANGIVTNTQIDKIGVSTGLTGGISGVISGAAGIEKVGAGSLVLSGTNTYAGVTLISSGTLQVGDGGAAGTLGGGAVTNNAALAFNRLNALTVPNAISGTGSLVQAGSGATVLTGNNSYTGSTTISSGTLQVGSGGAGSALGGTGTVANNGALIYNISDSQTLSRSITGSGNLVKSGVGTLTLAGNNSYAGGTTISGGTLTVAGTSSIGPGQVRFTGPSTLTVTSTAVTFPNAFDLGSVSGTVTLMVSTTSSTVINGPITGGSPNTTLFFDNPVGGANTGILTLNGTNSFQGSLMVYRGPLILGNASAAGASTLKLFANNNPAGDLQFGTGGFTIPNDVQLQLSGVNNWIGVPSGQTNGISGVISGNGFTKIGAGTLVLEADNSYSGGTTFTSGTIQVGNGGAVGSLGSGTVSNGGALVFNRTGSVTVSNAISGTGSVTTAGPGTIVLSGSNSFSGGTVLSAGVLALGSASAIGSTGTVSFGGGTLQFSASNTTDYSGRFSTANGQQYAIDTNGENVSLGSALTSSGGSFTKTGLGTLTLGGTNTYSGGTVVSAGRLVGTTVSLQGAITNDATVEFTQVSSGTYAGAMAGYGAFVKTGSGLLALTGSNTYAGATTISAGTVQVGSGGAAGELGGIGSVTNNGILAINRSDSVTFSRPITGSGGFQQIGNGTTTLAGANSYAGTTTITAGRLVGSTASLPGAIANAAQLEFAQASDGTFAAGISGTGSLTKTGAGNLILAGSSSYSGITSVAAGRLSVNGALGTTAVSVTSGTLGGSGSIAGPVSIASGGFLAPGNSIQSLATGTVTFAAGATFEFEVDSTDLGTLGTAADLLVVSGDLNLDPSNGVLLSFLDLNGSPNPFQDATTVFAMINYTGQWNGGLFTYGTNVLIDGEEFSVGGQEWKIDYDYVYNPASPTTTRPLNYQGDYLPSSGTQRFVAVTAIPEPSAFALAAIGAGLAAWAARRHRRGCRRINVNQQQSPGG